MRYCDRCYHPCLDNTNLCDTCYDEMVDAHNEAMLEQKWEIRMELMKEERAERCINHD